MRLTNREMSRLGELLDEALPLTPEQRRAWLDSLSSEDQPLVRSLRDALLAEEAGSGRAAGPSAAHRFRRHRGGRDGRPPCGRAARRIRTAAAAGVWRHGRRLARLPHRRRVRAPGGAQDPAPAGAAGGDGRALRARVQHPRHAGVSRDRSPVRRRRGRQRRSLHRDGVRAGRATGDVVRRARARPGGTHAACSCRCWRRWPTRTGAR